MHPPLLINIDVEDLVIAEEFYKNAFAMTSKRRFGTSGLEMEHQGFAVYLLEKEAGTKPFADADCDALRHYDRHWTPIHLDFVVDDLEEALKKAEKAGAIRRKGGVIREHKWGRIAELSDPFGNGFCILQFVGRGYDEIAG
ncbi:MAG: VOC family protein [Proteobacteria bacterium]|nr:MAG: VOC family protein [Pseudomonadota bacterium]